MKKLTILLTCLLCMPVRAAETCSRVATINYQEVLVDVSGNNRGEGLRYYLEKDQVSRELLNEYQENNRPTWKNAAMSTVGSGMILSSFLVTGNDRGDGLSTSKFLLFGGITLIGISYLISKTNQYNNEYLLLRAVEEYNKRNTPRIFFSPTDPQNGMGFGLGVGKEF